jgi:hypothetical protein
MYEISNAITNRVGERKKEQREEEEEEKKTRQKWKIDIAVYF